MAQRPAGPTGEVPVSNEAYTAAVRAYQAGQWAEAAEHMWVAEQRFPGESDALIIRAQALLRLADYAGASDSLHFYLDRHATSADAWYLLGQSLQKENLPTESLKAYSRASQYRSPRAEDYYTIGLDYALLHDSPDAIRWLEKAESMAPENLDTMYWLARCYYTQSRFNEAEKTFRRLIAVDPQSRRAYGNLALVLDALNRGSEADSAFRHAIDLANSDPKTNEWPYLDYGSFLLDHERPSDAVPILERAVAISNNCAACHEKLGRAYSGMARLAEAQEQMERAAALDALNPKMHFELSRIYKLRGNLERAKEESALSSKLYGNKDSSSRK